MFFEFHFGRFAKFSVYFSLIGSLAIGAGSAASQKRNITEKDLFDFVWIGDPQISPDGTRVVFVRVTVNEKKEGYNTSIWSVPVAGGEEPHQLTKGDHDSAPRWSPDGKFLLFLRATERMLDPSATIVDPADVRRRFILVHRSAEGAQSNPVWAPDGKTIAFASETNAEDLPKQEKKKRKEEE
jgi:dipeptidyl aminopeptidase/acylaminoacyl peptidase